MFYRFRRLKIGRVYAGFVDDALENFRIFQHGAGSQVVFVEGLIVVVGHKEGPFQNFQKGVVSDVGIRVVDKDARLRVPVGVDVEIIPSAGDAAVHIFPVVLEVHGKEPFSVLQIANGANAVFRGESLLRRGEQLHGSVVSYGHVVEIEGVASAFIYHKIDKFLARYGFAVL